MRITLDLLVVKPGAAEIHDVVKEISRTIDPAGYAIRLWKLADYDADKLKSLYALKALRQTRNLAFWANEKNPSLVNQRALEVLNESVPVLLDLEP